MSACTVVRILVARVSLLIALLAAPMAPALGQGLAEVTGFGSNPGNLRMFTWVPQGLPANAPLVVAMHGCSQSAANFDEETGWALLAERWQFALLLPQQQSSNNSSNCFNWFELGDIQRGQGEALSIRQMVARMQSDHGHDPARVYVTGLSAGAAMTAVMLASYPEVFAGGAIVAGVPYRCATSTNAAFNCMSPGVDLSPQEWGDRVRAASSHAGPWPIVSIWHGSSDWVVRPLNLTEAMEQWTHVHGIGQSPSEQTTLAGHPHKLYRDTSGRVVVETVLINGMGHGVPVDPGPGETQCGVAGAYILDVDVCSSYYIGRFWGLDNLDNTPPQVVLSAPADGAEVSGVVTLSAEASDDVAVARVEFLLDGLLLGSDDSAPYAIAWNSAAVSNGAHSLQARAIDLAGNVGHSPIITVQVSGGLVDSTAPEVAISFPDDGASVAGSVLLAAEGSDDFGVVELIFSLDGVDLGSGNASAQAGAWTLDWNSASVPDGSYALGARALDAAGNVGYAAAVAIVVDQNLPALSETFSDRDGSGDHYDQPGWSGDFVADAANATPGPVASVSALGYASSGNGCLTGLKTRSLSRQVELGDDPRLSYARRLDLKATTNTSTYAYFRVSIDGQTLDERNVAYANYSEADWQLREGIDLSAYAQRSVELRFEVGAYANVCIESYARAWLDDIRIHTADRHDDVTPPEVLLTAPADGAQLSGHVALAASASDESGVVKLEFYLNGSLLAVDGEAPYGYDWDTAAFADGEYSLQAKAYDPAGNVGSSSVVQVSVANGGSGSQWLVLQNENANDGYVKANVDGSGAAVGLYESYYGLAIGRGSDAKYNRSVLSFDTSAVPPGATVLSAVLTVRWRSGVGDPWGSPAGNRLIIDLHHGCLGQCSIEASDYSAAASALAVAEIAKFSSGEQNSSGFSPAGLDALNRDGRTQLRLRFEQNPTSTAHLWIDNGASATLSIEYVP